MRRSVLSVVMLAVVSMASVAQDPFGAQPKEDEQRDQKLAEYLTGSKFVGRFTIIGKEDGKMPTDEYTLQSVKKIPGGNLFMITARIKYGDKDLVVPMPIPVEWAGKTPMISLDNFTIPGMGTFSAKIVINKGRYAGTWSHDEKGGHMFGVIKKSEQPDNANGKPAEAAADEKE